MVLLEPEGVRCRIRDTPNRPAAEAHSTQMLVTMFVVFLTIPILQTRIEYIRRHVVIIWHPLLPPLKQYSEVYKP